jgi:acetyl esterase/lipase
LPGVAARFADEWRQQGFSPSALRLPSLVSLLTASNTSLAGGSRAAEVIQPQIHLYRGRGRDATAEPAPVIVDIHGGSWQHGSATEDARFAVLMSARGYVVFALDYRKAPAFRFPAQLDDVRASLQWIRDHASAYGGDASRLVLIGRSAGSQLALLAAYDGDAPGIRGVVAFYAPPDLAGLHDRPPSPDPLRVAAKLEDLFGGAPAVMADAYRWASPITYVRADLPPTLLLQGSVDHVTEPRFTRELQRALRARGNRALLLELPWADHSFDFVHFGPSNQLAQAAIDGFVRETTGGPPQARESRP